jgi:hypothetical protein
MQASWNTLTPPAPGLAALTFTPWFRGIPPSRPGWYSTSAARHAHHDGRQWSVQVDEDASDDAHTLARRTPTPTERQHEVEWRGLTLDSFAALALEMA